MADRPASMQRRISLLLLLAILPNALVDGMVIQRVFGANNSEVMFASSGGGTHVYLAGTGMCASRLDARARLHDPLHAGPCSSRADFTNRRADSRAASGCAFRRGSAFSPPSVFIGINADAECAVQPFTSTRNRLHCIMCAEPAC